MKLDPDLRRGIVISRCTDAGLMLSAVGMLYVLSRDPAWWIWAIDIPLLIGIACCLVLSIDTRRTIHQIQQMRDYVGYMKERRESQ